MTNKAHLNNLIDVPYVEDMVEEKGSKLDAKGRAYATGRRKEASARLWLSLGNSFKVGNVEVKDYFASEALADNALSPLRVAGMQKVNVFCTVTGGGKRAQSDAIKLALAKALCLFDHSFKDPLKKQGMLTTDSRVKEREHYGFRTSRKPQQYCRR